MNCLSCKSLCSVLNNLSCKCLCSVLNTLSLNNFQLKINLFTKFCFLSVHVYFQSTLSNISFQSNLHNVFELHSQHRNGNFCKTDYIKKCTQFPWQKFKATLVRQKLETLFVFCLRKEKKLEIEFRQGPGRLDFNLVVSFTQINFFLI